MESQPNYSAPDIAASRSRFPEEAAAAGTGPEAFTGSAGGHNGHGGGGGPAPADALKDAAARFAELKEYAALLLAAKLDGVKLTVRNVVIYAALGGIGAVIGATVLVTASVYLLSGLSGAIAAIFPDRYGWWIGRLIVAVLVIGGTAAGVVFGMKWLTGSSRKRTIEKYENRKRIERSLYGRDVEQRAREQAQREREKAAGAA
jgi:hypothetical protein